MLLFKIFFIYKFINMSSTINIYSSSFISNNKSIEMIPKKLNINKIYYVQNPFANSKKINFHTRLSCEINDRNQELFKKYYLSGLKKKKIKRQSIDYQVYKVDYIKRKYSKLKKILSNENIQVQKFNNKQVIEKQNLTIDNENTKIFKKISETNGLFSRLKNIFCCVHNLTY